MTTCSGLLAVARDMSLGSRLDMPASSLLSLLLQVAHWLHEEAQAALNSQKQ